MDYSILYLGRKKTLTRTQPPFFEDLNLAKVVDEIALTRKDYSIKEHFTVWHLQRMRDPLPSGCS